MCVHVCVCACVLAYVHLHVFVCVCVCEGCAPPLCFLPHVTLWYVLVGICVRALSPCIHADTLADLVWA